MNNWSFELTTDQMPQVIHRLRTACGHLDSVTRMVEAGQPCEKIIHQLGAIQAAIREIGLAIIEKEILLSSEIILTDDSDDEDKEIAARHILDLFILLTKPYKNLEWS